MLTRRGFLKTTGSAAAVAGLSGSVPAFGARADAPRGDGILGAKPALRDPWSTERSARVFGTGAPGPTWPKAEMLSFTAEIDGDVSRVWLPPPLEPTRPAKAMLFVTRYPMTKLGFGYNEAAVFLHGQHEGSKYLHCTWMVVDDDTALILGREMLGFPKKMAQIDADNDPRRPWGRVRRKGLPVFEITGSNPRKTADARLFDYPVVNVLGDTRSGAELLQIGGAEVVHSGHEVDFEVKVGPSDLDPLYRLGIQERQKGLLMVVDLGVGGQTPAAQPTVPDLTGTPVAADWMLKAYPFRVW